MSMKKLSYHNIFESILLGIGVFGLLGGFYDAFLFPKGSEYAVACFIIFAIILYNIHVVTDKLKYLKRGILLVLSACMLYSLSDFIILLESIKEVIVNDYFLSVTELFNTAHTPPILVVMIYMIFGFLITFLLVQYIYNNRYQKTILLFCSIWMIFPYFIIHPVSSLYFYPSVFFIISSYFYKTSLQSLQSKGVCLQIIISVFLILALFGFDYTIAHNSVFQKNVIEIFPGLQYLKESNGSNNGQLGASNKLSGNLPTGDIEMNVEEALTVTSDTPFSGYLRGYSLSTYQNNKWDTPKKGTLYPSINYYVDAISKGDSFRARIRTKEKYTYQFVPYYSNVGNTMTLDSFVPYFETNHTVILDNQNIDKIKSVDQEYQNYVKNNYLEVNTNTLTILDNYLKEHAIDIVALKKQPVSKKIEVIRELLINNTSYSLTAGTLPEGVDFIDNFLNISKYGSCTHYSTSAALMLRIVDVPTRFVSGFVISKSDFKDREAIIRNNRSHAWVEVFDTDYGWYPVEFTPASQGMVNEETENPGAISNMLDNHLPQEEQPDTPIEETPAPEGKGVPSVTPNQETKIEIPVYVLEVLVAISILVIIYVQRKVRYQKKIKRYLKLNSNQKVCHGYQYIKKHQIAMQPIENIALKAKFSQYTITKEELTFFEEYTKQQVEKVYTHLPIYKKIYYTYMQAKR